MYFIILGYRCLVLFIKMQSSFATEFVTAAQEPIRSERTADREEEAAALEGRLGLRFASHSRA